MNESKSVFTQTPITVVTRQEESHTVYQTKWGFVPCSYAEYQEMKEKHKLLLKAYLTSLRYYRWQRKLPKNRSGDSPISEAWRTSLGLEDAVNDRQQSVNDRKNWNIKQIYLVYLKEYQKSHRPKLTAEEVEKIKIDPKATQLIAKIAGNPAYNGEQHAKEN